MKRRARSGAATASAARRGPDCDLAIWDIDAPADLVYRIGFNPLHARGARTARPACLLEQHMSNTLVLRPGHVTLAQWRQVYRGAPLALDPAALPVVRASAAAVAAIVAKGAPVYGINTGFGKLASVRIEREDLATLQRNIVLSHAAGVGEPMPASVVRLMMALKLVSLAQGASGIREETLLLLEAMLIKGVLPVVPAQGSVGASGDLAPLSHLAGVMLGVGEATSVTNACPQPTHWRGPACSRSIWAQRKVWPCSTAPVLHRLCAGRPVRNRNRVPGGTGHRRVVGGSGQGFGHAV